MAGTGRLPAAVERRRAGTRPPHSGSRSLPRSENRQPTGDPRSRSRLLGHYPRPRQCPHPSGTFRAQRKDRTSATRFRFVADRAACPAALDDPRIPGTGSRPGPPRAPRGWLLPLWGHHQRCRPETRAPEPAARTANRRPK